MVNEGQYTRWVYLWGHITHAGAMVPEGEVEERSFNDLGAEGWELVRISGFTAYFKRPAPEGAHAHIETKAVLTPAQQRMAHARAARGSGQGSGGGKNGNRTKSA